MLEGRDVGSARPVPATGFSALDALATVLPRGAVLVGLGFNADPGGLFEAEEKLLIGAAPRRRADFAAGRLCARRALAMLDAPIRPILVGSGGEPVWPSGFTGSVTHCPGLAAAVAAEVTGVGGLGLDVERRQTLTSGMRELMCANADELAWLERHPDLAVVAFSIKEAVMKAWWPIAGSWPGFAGVTVESLGDGDFVAGVTDGVRPPTVVEGLFSVDAALVCAVAVIEGGGPPR